MFTLYNVRYCLDRGQLFHVTKCYQWKIPYVFKIRNTRSIEFVSWTSLVIEESLSSCLTGLRYSPFAYLTLICMYPFIRWLKISST